MRQGVANSVFYWWPDRLEANGSLDSPSSGGLTDEVWLLLELKAENLLLRRIVADKELELMIKRDLLKKNYCIVERREVTERNIISGCPVLTVLMFTGLSATVFTANPEQTAGDVR